MQVVGDELIPFSKVKDFAPYTKIKASGAADHRQLGPDMNLLIGRASMPASTRCFTRCTPIAAP